MTLELFLEKVHYFLPLICTAIVFVIINFTFFFEEQFVKKLEKKPFFKQILIGIVFGLGVIFANEKGSINVEGVLINARDAGPLTAGLIYGPIPGFIAGIVGGFERWFSVYWGAGIYTRIACSVACIIAATLAFLFRKYVFDNKRPTAISGGFLAVVSEVIHMLLVFVTHPEDPIKAFSILKIATIPMVVANVVIVFVTLFVVNYYSDNIDFANGVKKSKIKNITSALQLRVFAVLFIVLFAALVFQDLLFRSTGVGEMVVYVSAYIFVIVFAALYVLVYVLVNQLIVKNINTLNGDLAAITDGDLDRVINVRSFLEFHQLSNHLNKMIVSLKRLIAEAKARIAAELEYTRKIQYSALPLSLASLSAEERFDIYATMNTAKEVGGDFYDFFYIGEEKFEFLIADVSGKGIPAAMFMMKAKSTIKSFTETYNDLEQAISFTNRELCENNSGEMFVTAFICIINLKTGVVEYINAGHNPPVYAHKDGTIEYLEGKKNLVLAGMDELNYKKGEFTMKEGDFLYLYTDGVTEAIDREENMYTEGRLLKVIEGSKLFNMHSLCDNISADLSKFTSGADQFDDITMLGFRYKGVDK